MFSITNIVTTHIRTSSPRQICGGKNFATIVMDRRKNTKVGVLLFWLVGWFVVFCFVGCFWEGGIFYLHSFIPLSFRRTRNPINLQPQDLYETQIKVLYFHSTYLLTGKGLLEVYFKDSLAIASFTAFPSYSKDIM